jgi:hypothetical protein
MTTELPREKATEQADLPHKYDGPVSLTACDICKAPLADPRHLAWEKAQADDDTPSTLPREMGV